MAGQALIPGRARKGAGKPSSGTQILWQIAKDRKSIAFFGTETLEQILLQTVLLDRC